MREIVIDTETTGLDSLSGHRVVEIGAVELVDNAPTSGLAPSQAKVRVGIRVPVRFVHVPLAWERSALFTHVGGAKT